MLYLNHRNCRASILIWGGKSQKTLSQLVTSLPLEDSNGMGIHSTNQIATWCTSKFRHSLICANEQSVMQELQFVVLQFGINCAICSSDSVDFQLILHRHSSLEKSLHLCQQEFTGKSRSLNIGH